MSESNLCEENVRRIVDSTYVSRIKPRLLRKSFKKFDWIFSHPYKSLRNLAQGASSSHARLKQVNVDLLPHLSRESYTRTENVSLTTKVYIREITLLLPLPDFLLDLFTLRFALLEEQECTNVRSASIALISAVLGHESSLCITAGSGGFCGFTEYHFAAREASSKKKTWSYLIAALRDI